MAFYWPNYTSLLLSDINETPFEFPPAWQIFGLITCHKFYIRRVSIIINKVGIKSMWT